MDKPSKWEFSGLIGLCSLIWFCLIRCLWVELHQHVWYHWSIWLNGAVSLGWFGLITVGAYQDVKVWLIEVRKERAAHKAKCKAHKECF